MTASTFDGTGSGDPALQACLSFCEHLLNQIATAMEPEPAWPLKVRAGVLAALGLLTADPVMARLLAIDAMTGGPELMRARCELAAQLAEQLQSGREQIPEAAGLAQCTEEGLVGGMMALVIGRLIADRADELPDLAPQLIELALIPYIGPEEARRIARQPSQ